MGNPFEQAAASSPAEEEEVGETPEVAVKREEDEYAARQERYRQEIAAQQKEKANSRETARDVTDGVFDLARFDIDQIDDLSTWMAGSWVGHLKESDIEQAKRVLDKLLEVKQAEKKA